MTAPYNQGRRASGQFPVQSPEDAMRMREANATSNFFVGNTQRPWMSGSHSGSAHSASRPLPAARVNTRPANAHQPAPVFTGLGFDPGLISPHQIQQSPQETQHSPQWYQGIPGQNMPPSFSNSTNQGPVWAFTAESQAPPSLIFSSSSAPPAIHGSDLPNAVNTGLQNEFSTPPGHSLGENAFGNEDFNILALNAAMNSPANLDWSELGTQREQSTFGGDDVARSTPQQQPQLPRIMADLQRAAQENQVPNSPASRNTAAAQTNYQRGMANESATLDLPALVQQSLQTLFSQPWAVKHVDTSRLYLLQDAFRQHDWFFICAHQLFCVHAGNSTRSAALGISGKHHAGLGLLAMVLNTPQNEQPSPQGLSRLSSFPANLEQLAQEPWYKGKINFVITFLEKLGQGWSGMFELCQRRGFPPFQEEQLQYLGLPSPVLQKLVFSCLQRNLNSGLTRDQAQRGLQVFDYHTSQIHRQRADGRQPLSGSALEGEINGLGERYKTAISSGLQSSSPVNGVASSSSTFYQLPMSSGISTNLSSNQQTATPASIGGSSVPEQLDSRRSSFGRYTQIQPRPGVAPSTIFFQVGPNSWWIPSTANSSTTAMHLRAQGQPRTNPVTIGPVSQQSGRRPNNSQNTSMPQRRPSTVKPLPRNLFIPPEGYEPIDRVNPDTNRVALHQAHLKSPRLEKLNSAGGIDPDLKLYQYIAGLAVGPLIVEPSVTSSFLSFQVDDASIARLPKDVASTYESGPARLVSDQTLFYRIRMITIAPETTRITESDWAVKDTYWSPFCFVTFNGESMELRRKLHHHKDLPLDITSLLKAGTNELSLSFLRTGKDTNIPHCAVAIEIVRVGDATHVSSLISNISAPESLRIITESMMLASKAHKRLSSASNTLGTRRVRQNTLLSSDSDSDDESDSSLEILDEHISIDLIDPFTATIVTLPTRGKTCTHRECFDLDTFLSTRRPRPSQHPNGPTSPDEWKCPICGGDARPQNLLVDSFLKGVRDELELGAQAGGTPLDDIRAILVQPDGKVKIKPPESRGVRSGTENQSGTSTGLGGTRRNSATVLQNVVIDLGDDI